MSKLVLSLFVFFTGLTVIFLGITILIICVLGVGAILKKTSAPKIDKEKVQIKSETESLPVSQSSEIPVQVKAAIIAAISAYYGNENPQCEFKVKKIKRLY